MSSRGSPIPNELADAPTSPFKPVLPGATSRRPIVRRPGAPPARPSTPFGEIGKEDDDNFDVLSMISGTSGWVGPEVVDEEAAVFLPRVRDLRQRRPVVRKRTVDVPASLLQEEIKGDEGQVEAKPSTDKDRTASDKDGQDTQSGQGGQVDEEVGKPGQADGDEQADESGQVDNDGKADESGQADEGGQADEDGQGNKDGQSGEDRHAKQEDTVGAGRSPSPAPPPSIPAGRPAPTAAPSASE
ncbi:hypothetical protein JCM3770_006854 [Rhodotorula araucariae]